MDTPQEQQPRRGMSFPFFLTLLLFAAVLADLYFVEPGFVASAAYRQNGYILVGVVIVAFLLWLWVLVAARRRTSRFDGPIQTSRGTNGALQPILATIFLVIAANLAWTQAIPRWLNYLLSEDVLTERFTVAGSAVPKSRCDSVPATSDAYGAVTLCLPPGVAQDVGAAPGRIIEATGPATWFGIEPGRYRGADDEPIMEPQLVVGGPSGPATAPDAASDGLTAPGKQRIEKNR
jgi:hypothetical protein